jgi:alpha/beta superfamily hydrolase
MRTSLLPAGVCALAAFAAATALAQADYAREKRLADEVVQGIVVGDPEWLEMRSGHKVLGIFMPAPKATAGVVTVHGLGVHPDWSLIGTLRVQLAEHGYATLSVQMPVLKAGAGADRYEPLFPEAAERIDAAVAWLRGKGMKRVAVVSHSLGARMANHFLIQPGRARVDAWVAIGLSAGFVQPQDFRAPVLDVYGENDFPAVLESAPVRAAALRKIRRSGQVQVAGADHFFTGQEGELARQVRQFLDSRLK